MVSHGDHNQSSLGSYGVAAKLLNLIIQCFKHHCIDTTILSLLKESIAVILYRMVLLTTFEGDRVWYSWEGTILGATITIKHIAA